MGIWSWLGEVEKEREATMAEERRKGGTEEEEEE